MAEIKALAYQTARDFQAHNVVCTERQGELKKLVWTVINILMGVTAAVVVGLVTTVANFIIHYPTGH